MFTRSSLSHGSFDACFLVRFFTTFSGEALGCCVCLSAKGIGLSSWLGSTRLEHTALLVRAVVGYGGICRLDELTVGRTMGFGGNFSAKVDVLRPLARVLSKSATRFHPMVFSKPERDRTCYFYCFGIFFCISSFSNFNKAIWACLSPANCISQR